MKQKLIALAIASALSAPAFADNANITVYGKAFLTLDSHNNGTNTSMRVNTNASRFGVKGSEDLGDGLKGLFQYEVEMDADGSGGNGLGKTRNSYFGLQGDFGKVALGIHDTPFKVAHNKIELFDNTTSWSATNVIGRSAGKNYNTRQKNMVQYWTPKMGALSAAIMYSPDEAKTSTSNKGIMSMSATFAQDNIYAAAGYESRADVTVGTTDSAFRLVGKFDLADAWVGAMLENIKTNTSTTASVTGNNVELVGGVKMGAGSIAASFAKAGSTAVGTAAANDVNNIAIKYAYKFSKRTEGFVAYGSKKTNGATSVTATTFGGGFLHSF
jgi:predicted porin